MHLNPGDIPMKYSLASATRRAMRLARAARPRSPSKAMRRAISKAMARTAAASLSTLSAMTPKARAPKPRAAKASAVKSNAPRSGAAGPKVARVARKPAAAAQPSGGRHLGAVVRQLRAARAAMPDPFLLSAPTRPSKPPAIPKGAQYLDWTHSGRTGARDFKLFVPAGQPAGPRGLVVMLHGCAQDPNDFANGTDMNRIAQAHGLAVAYPAQTRDHNGASCWNWFAPAHQMRGTGEPAILASLARGLMREFGLAPSEVFVAGLSAGGAMAVILGDTYPDVFSAVGVHSGLPRGAASTVMSALSAMRSGAAPASAAGGPARSRPNRRRIVFHGDADSTVHPSNAPQIVLGAVGSRAPARVTPGSAAGRDYVRTQYLLPDGTVDVELWLVKGAGHAWSGGKAAGSYTDPRGPDASGEMLRFFLTRPG